MEVWKDIKGFEEYYEVSTFGRIRRKLNETIYKNGRVGILPETILKPSVCRKGYLRVYLSVKAKKYTKRIHRLVADTFIENPHNKETVNHKNCNKQDNHINNLEWMSNLENMRHAFKNGVFDERDKNRKRGEDGRFI